MKDLVIRLKDSALRSLWTESDEHKARRRGQLFLTMPFIVLGGIIWGALAAPSIGDGSPLLWSVIGAAGFGIFFYLEQRLLPLVTEVASRVGLGAVAALAWEVGVVGGLLFLFTSVLGAPVVPAVTLAIGIGFTYSLAMEYLVFGSGADHFANFLGLGRGWSGARGSDYSHAEALEKREEFERAAEIYQEAIWTNRRDPQPHLRLARVRTQTGYYEEAIDILRNALKVAQFSKTGEALAVREIHEISATHLGDSTRAAPDLARYLERKPKGGHEKWARGALANIKDEIRENN